jgi:hypothetical protein
MSPVLSYSDLVPFVCSIGDELLFFLAAVVPELPEVAFDEVRSPPELSRYFLFR